MEIKQFEKDLEILMSHSNYAYKYAKKLDDNNISHLNCELTDISGNIKELLALVGWYEKYGVEPDDSFHPNGAGCILLNDDYLFGIRCDHLIWIDYWDLYGYKTLLIGNHKGGTNIKVITYNEEN